MMVMPGKHKHLSKGNLCGLGKEISVLLVRRSSEVGISPELRREVCVSVLQSMEHSLDEVTHGTGVPTRRGVAILDSSHVHELLSSRRSNKSGSARSRNETNTNGSTLSGDLAGNGMGKSSLTSPVSTADRGYVELSSSDSSTDSGSYLRGTLDSKTNMSVVVSKSNEGLETGTLTSRRLLLNRHDLHNLIVKLVLEEELDDLSLLHRHGEKENLLDGRNLSLLDETSKLGDRGPSLLLTGSLSASTSTSTTTATAAISAAASSSSKTSSIVRHYFN
jgi:hypothetical protein